jgi:phosphinothricin acetyltransferase
MIRTVKPGDAEAIATIYNYYVKNTVITFEELPVSVNGMGERIRTVGAAYPWLVWEEAGELSGYAYVSTWKERTAYRFSAEVSIYIRTDCRGKGIGRELFGRLLDEVRKTNIHALVSGITLPNEASVALHERFGFTCIARFNEIGYKLDRWLDVGYWELILPPAHGGKSA